MKRDRGRGCIMPKCAGLWRRHRWQAEHGQVKCRRCGAGRNPHSRQPSLSGVTKEPKEAQK